MVETRVQLALRMLRSTLGLGDGSPLELAMAKASLLDVSLWMSLGDAQLAALTYPDGGVDRTLKLGHYLILKVYQVFVVHHRANGEGPSFDASMSTPDEFDEFNGSNGGVLQPEIR